MGKIQIRYCTLPTAENRFLNEPPSLLSLLHSRAKEEISPRPPRFMIELLGYACMSFENVKHVCV